jgi:hypothetical protein
LSTVPLFRSYLTGASQLRYLEYFLLSFACKKALMCPNADPDLGVLRRDVYKSIKAAEAQVKLLALRLLRSRQRLNELQAEQRETKKVTEDRD